MKKHTIKRLLLPVGLLITGSSYLFNYLDPALIDIKDFVLGLGVAIVASALFFRVRWYYTGK